MLGAIDDRLAAQAPVVMVSHTMQGGCRCENMPGLRVKYSNMEIAAAPAPRPQILVSDTRDWTKTTLEMEGPAILGIYQLLGGSQKLRYVRYDFEHNYNQTSREAVYQWFDHWLIHQTDDPIKEQPFQKEPDADLRVFPDGQLPADAISKDALMKYIIDGHRKRLAALDPARKRYEYEQVMWPAWEHTLQLDWRHDEFRQAGEELHAAIKDLSTGQDYSAQELEITRTGEDRTLKVVSFIPFKGSSVQYRGKSVLLVDTKGAGPFIDEAGNPRGLALRLLKERVAVDVLADSGPPANPKQTDLLYTTYNRTRLQERVRDLISIRNALANMNPNRRPYVVCGSGVAGLWCLLAAPGFGAVVADCDQINSSDDNALLSPDLFCPGIRDIDTFQGALALASPYRDLLLHNTGTAFELDRVRPCYKSMKAETRRFDDEEIAAWIAAVRLPGR